MLKISKKTILFSIIFSTFASSNAHAVYVKGHYRKNGSYVQGYNRSSSNSYKYDNYSSRGNTNPYTGKRGYKNPY